MRQAGRLVGAGIAGRGLRRDGTEEERGGGMEGDGIGWVGIGERGKGMEGDGIGWDGRKVDGGEGRRAGCLGRKGRAK